jgi:hypothetical protein
MWEELFYGINKSGRKDGDKMTLEENIRCYNALAVGGDLRATVDRKMYGEAKTTMMAGLQYTSFHEYLSGDTKGALERLHFCLSDVFTAKRIGQEQRSADRSASVKCLVDMLTAHVEHMFPPTVMQQYEASLEEVEGEGGKG